VLLDISIEVPPASKSGGKHLTEDEENEYRQVQGLVRIDCLSKDM